MCRAQVGGMSSVECWGSPSFCLEYKSVETGASAASGAVGVYRGPWRGSEDSPCLTWGLMGSGVSTVSPGHDGDVSCFFLLEFDYLRINMWGSVGEMCGFYACAGAYLKKAKPFLVVGSRCRPCQRPVVKTSPVSLKSWCSLVRWFSG